MKYPKEVYEEMQFYGGDEMITHHKQKVVKTRKEHFCVGCGRKIEKGENALNERAFVDNKPCSVYTCIECCDKWIEEVGLWD